MRTFMSTFVIVASFFLSGLVYADTSLVFESKPEQHFKQVLGQLDLSEDQKEEISQIMRQAEPEIAQNTLKSNRNNHALAQISDSNYDEERVTKLADEQGRIEANTIKLRMKIRHEIYELFTPMQRLKVAELGLG